MVNWRKLHPHYYTEFYRRMFEELRKQFGGKCKHCDSTEDLQFAHIKDTKLNGKGRGLKTRYYDIKNHPDCYALLAKICHYEFDKLSPELREGWLNGNER